MKEGFVALISVLIISLVTATYALLGSADVLLTLSEASRLSDRSQARIQAQACLVIAAQYGLMGYEIDDVDVASVPCTIREVSLSSFMTIRSSGIEGVSSVELEAVFPGDLEEF